MLRMVSALFVGVLLLASPVLADAQKLQDLVGSAKAGQTVDLPAGEFVGGATLPEGVSLKGAGYGKTIIDAKGSLNGIVVKGNGATVSDLTVRGAKGAGVVVEGGQSVTISRVRSTGCVNGFLLSKAVKARIENCISDHNNFGVVVNGGSDCVVVNCTVSNCVEMGLSIAASTNVVVFNNCVAGSGICLNIDKPANVQADHNLYFGLFVGQMNDQGAKKLLTGWQGVTVEDGKSGLDIHSVQMPVEFKDSKGGDVTPASVLPWALDRASTGDWGVAEFAGVKAPLTDINGKARAGLYDVGAVETTIQAPRTADGEFTIISEKGPKSAGVFTKDGMLVSYLFQNLPLPAGKYAFWLPVRDYVGKAIPAGEYEVRVTESDFRWKYLNHIGDNGGDRYGPYTASAIPKLVAFAGNDVLLMQQGQSEDHIVVRAYDVKTGKVLWYTYGTPVTQGLAVKDGIVYSLIQHNVTTGQSRLTRIDLASGAVKPWPGAETGHVFPTLSPALHSMAALGDRLYVAAPAANKIHVLTIADGKVEKALDVPAPKCVAADDKNNLLWVASGDSLLAIDASGKQVAQSNAVSEPVEISACNGRLAVASSKTGKVHFFDASNPSDLKPAGEFGTGDGPYGKFELDRFYFKKAPAWGFNPDDIAVGVAINASGDLAVTDAQRRLSVFDKDGKNLWYTFGIFGNQARYSYGTQNRRMWDTWIRTSFLMNEQDGTWQVEGLWDFSAVTPKGLRESNCQVLGDFKEGDKVFLVSVLSAMGRPKDQNISELPLLIVARLDDFKAVPVLTIGVEDGKMVSRKDTNADGKITREDAMEPVMGADGNPMPPADMFSRFNDLQPDGSITAMGKPGFIWKRTPGLDAAGVPIYEGKNWQPIANKDWTTAISPYDYKPDGVQGLVQIGYLSDGGYIGQTIMRESGGMGLNNGAGTDLCGYTADGRLRWVNQMAQYHGIAGMGTVDDITVTAVYYSMDVPVVDADGLGLGAFCEDAKLHYCGYWIDHPNMRLFKMPDNHIYMTNGDNTAGRHLWYRLENQESLKKGKYPFAVNQQRAAELAALEFTPVPPPVVPQPKISIPKLAGPMTIDGSLEKWRTAGVQPQIVMGPAGKVKNASDCSALIRIAYESNNLYFQVLSFDDVPVFGNFPVWQNSVELAINGVWPNGMQFVAGKQANGKDVVWRNRFFSQVPQVFFPPEHAPCVVKVLENAKDVSEREMLEQLYGEDMSNAKVIVTEFKIPMDKVTYATAESDVPELGTGKTFWINFFIDDSDRPYTDVQEKVLIWPVGSGMFGAKEDAAFATCE